jgi:hypothetical protein
MELLFTTHVPVLSPTILKCWVVALTSVLCDNYGKSKSISLKVRLLNFPDREER